MAKVFSYSVASVSWINAKTELPEVDKSTWSADSVVQPVLTANHGYRFCNFLDVYIEVAPDGKISSYGFYPQSGIYRGPSYGDIPSHAFPVNHSKTISPKADFVTFRQVVGARTVSAEHYGKRVGLGLSIAFFPLSGLGVVGSAIAGWFGGGTAAHQIIGFPPIWSILEIRLFSSGYAEETLVQHSIFPSLTYFVQGGVTAERDKIYKRRSIYDARKEIELPKWQENGWGQIQGASGPSKGNPWGAEKGITGGDDSSPN